MRLAREAASVYSAGHRTAGPTTKGFDQNHVNSISNPTLTHAALQVLNESWDAAAKALQRALSLNHPEHARNRAAILLYLVPIHLLRGELPSEAVLGTPGLELYKPFVAALRAGDVAAFEAALAAGQVLLMKVLPPCCTGRWLGTAHEGAAPSLPSLLMPRLRRLAGHRGADRDRMKCELVFCDHILSL